MYSHSINHFILLAMKISYDIKHLFQSLVYVFAGIYAWIDSTGLNPKIVTVLAILMALDMFLGIWKASALSHLDNPTSKKAKKGIFVKLVIFVIPAVSGLIWGALGDAETAMRVVNVQLAGLMVAEGYSNIGNAYAIYTGEEISEFDAFTFIFKKTAENIRQLLNKILGDEK